MDDLKARLRELASFNRVHYPALCEQQEFYALGDEAADRIEKLEAENAELREKLRLKIIPADPIVFEP